MRTRRKLLIALFLLLILGLLALALRPPATPVSIAQVQRGPFAEFVSEEGRTQVRDPHTVHAPIGGYLRRVLLEPGDPVSAGAVVFQLEALPAPALDPRSREQAREQVFAAEARLRRAEAELEIAAAERDLAERDYRRNLELYEQQFIAAESMDRSEGQRTATIAAERAARHAIEVARFELESARASLAIADGRRAAADQPSLDVTAPIGGTVINRHRCCEGPVAAGDPILDIGNLDALEVRVDLLSMDAVRVRPGMRVIIEQWGGGTALEGVVRRVEPRGFQRVSALGVEEQRVPVLVDLRSPREEWAALGEGYRVEGRFILWEDEDVVHVPTSALFREGEGWQVFVVEDGRVHPRDVEPGRRSGLRSQILRGLQAGETVVTHPSDRLERDLRVTTDSND